MRVSRIVFPVIAILVLFSHGAAAILSGVVIHESTHIVLNGFRFDGFCFLDCNPMSNVGMVGSGYTPIGVYLSEPKNLLAEREELPMIAGVAGGTACFLFLGGRRSSGKN